MTSSITSVRILLSFLAILSIQKSGTRKAWFSTWLNNTEVYLIPFISTQIHTIIGWSPDSIHVLGQRWQMTLTQYNFANLPLVGPTSWASVGPMISANNVYNLLTRCQQILIENYDGPTMAHPWPNNEPTVSSHQLISMWFN